MRKIDIFNPNIFLLFLLFIFFINCDLFQTDTKTEVNDNDKKKNKISNLVTEFGHAGSVNIIAGEYSKSEKIIVQTDKKIITAGTYTITDSDHNSFYHTYITRHTQNGLPDTGFGLNGMIKYSADCHNYFCDILQLPDEKILVLIRNNEFSGKSYINTTIIGYTKNGQLDTSFGNNGIVTLESPLKYFILQSDNRIIGLGNERIDHDEDIVIHCLKLNGEYDTDFGNNGIVTTDILGRYDYANTLKVTADNKIFVGGYSTRSDKNILLIKYLENGGLDNSFGDRGFILLDLGPDDSICKLFLESDGSVIAVDNTGVLMKFDSSGILDKNFAEKGIADNNLYHIHQIDDACRLSDGKIILSGSHLNIPAIFQLGSDGLLDKSLNDNGILYLKKMFYISDKLYLVKTDDNKVISYGSKYINLHSQSFLVCLQF